MPQPGARPPVREKVVAYLLRVRGGAPEVAVFDHVGQSEAGTQVPSGSVERGETPEAACLREVAEEAGVTDARILAGFGVHEYLHPVHRQIHRRHVFALVAPGAMPDSWTWAVRGSGADAGLTFRFAWMDASEAVSRLAGEQGTYLDAVIADSGVCEAVLGRTGVAFSGAPWTGPPSIRPASRRDAAVLVWLWTALGACYRSIEDLRPVRWADRSRELRRRLLEEAWDDPQRHAVFLAETDQAVAGFVRAALTDTGVSAGRIETLFVAADWRGRGVGRALLERACAWCAEGGAPEVSVDCIASDGSAQALYAAAGFRPLLATYFRTARPEQ